MGLLFYPRGGSAQVASYLSHALNAQGWPVTLATGSLGPSGALGHAAEFFAGIETVPAYYDEAVARFDAGGDPMDAPFPMQPSYERREGVPDRSFTQVSPEQGARMVAAWSSLIAGSPRLQRACAAPAPRDADPPGRRGRAGARPDRDPPARDRAEDAAGDRRSRDRAGPPRRLVGRAHGRVGPGRGRDDRDLPFQHGEAVRLLGLDPETVHWLPDGVDVERFSVRRPGVEERRSRWLEWLVRDPHGWDEASGRPGSIRYTEDEVLDAFFDADTGEPRPVLMFVGRFLGFKRVPLLVRAYARARARMSVPAPLVIWGGAPGEWEGEHPHTVATELGVDGVFFAGWRGHGDLPLGLASADCFVAPSTAEPFGLVYLEAMSCGLPVIGTQSGGPPSFVNVVPGEPDGWLVPPDDEAALADAIVGAIDAPDARRWRGENAARHVRESYSWRGLAGRFTELYERVSDARRA